MSVAPNPLTPPDCDLSDFPYMELDVRRLRDSKFAATPNGNAFRAGVLLWCAAWHQVPAGSLPDDDIELSNLSGFGRLPPCVKEWKKVRAEALTGFIKCSDGRLYHPVVAEKVLAAFKAKGDFAYKKFLDRLRKENAVRDKEGKATFGIPTREQWNSGAYPHGIPPETVQIPTEIATDSKSIPSETVLKGNREGEEKRGNGEGDINSVPDGTGGDAAKSPAELTKAELWTAGKSLLLEAGMAKAQCGSFVGKLCKDYGDDIVIEAVRATVVARPADPAEYLKAICMRAKGERRNGTAESKFQLSGLDRAGDHAAQAESMRRHGIDSTARGDL